MSVMRLVSAGLAAIALATAPVALSASDNAVPSKDGKAAQSVTAEKAPSTTFATLKGVKAAPMSSSELDAVKGLHVHFITISNGKLHIAGNEFHHNWSNEWGGTDGQPVAPSYKGLCVAHGNGSIFIPTGPGNPVTLQCPAGS